MKHYNELVAFKDKEEHCLVPTNRCDSLSRWVYDQRCFNKKGKMRRDRKELLIKVGFVWDANASLWDTHLDKLKAFKQEHGHCKVTKKKDSALYQWVWNQRTYERNGTLAKDRFAALDLLGFEWDPRGLDSKEDDRDGSAKTPTKKRKMKESPSSPKRPKKKPKTKETRRIPREVANLEGSSVGLGDVFPTVQLMKELVKPTQEMDKVVQTILQELAGATQDKKTPAQQSLEQLTYNAILESTAAKLGDHYFKAHLLNSFVDNDVEPACFPTSEDFLLTIKDSKVLSGRTNKAIGKAIGFVSTDGTTISPTHTDRDPSLLVVLMGQKEIMYGSANLKETLINEGHATSSLNSDYLDNFNPFDDMEKWLQKGFSHIVLNEGDACFIPSRWLHCVKSCEKTVAVSFQVQLSENASSSDKKSVPAKRATRTQSFQSIAVTQTSRTVAPKAVAFQLVPEEASCNEAHELLLKKGSSALSSSSELAKQRGEDGAVRNRVATAAALEAMSEGEENDGVSSSRKRPCHEANSNDRSSRRKLSRKECDTKVASRPGRNDGVIAKRVGDGSRRLTDHSLLKDDPCPNSERPKPAIACLANLRAKIGKNAALPMEQAPHTWRSRNVLTCGMRGCKIGFASDDAMWCLYHPTRACHTPVEHPLHILCGYCLPRGQSGIEGPVGIREVLPRFVIEEIAKVVKDKTTNCGDEMDKITNCDEFIYQCSSKGEYESKLREMRGETV
uniref:JmjC domain-containing protein n=1 Tax=Grammatophora oceanica TaxID=210454 RepID=A0A7S1UPC1_9STRA|mmetsp:Transcript_15691/g.23081  ORF Transcript_15691/g.23081 Transcript_15691/m.23081 type:complete len:731 (+) Transcript_15691:631-2823(+)